MTDRDRDAAIAAFFAREAAGLQRLVTRRCSSDALAAEGCSHAWEQLLTHPEVTLDHAGRRWLLTVAEREAWRIQSDQRRASSLDAGVDGDERLADVLASGEPSPDTRIESARRLAMLDHLKPDERRVLSAQATGHSRAEIVQATGWTATKVDRLVSEGRQRLRTTQTPTTDLSAVYGEARDQRRALEAELQRCSSERIPAIAQQVAARRHAEQELQRRIVNDWVRHPPPWAVMALGERPPDAARAHAWRQGLEIMGTYRLVFCVDDRESLLGIKPTNAEGRTAFEVARQQLADVQARLGREGPSGRQPSANPRVPRRLPSSRQDRQLER